MNENKNVLELICSNGFITVNKAIARTIGLNEAIVLGELCSVSKMFDFKEFFFTIEKMSYDTCLSDYLVSQALKKLESLGLIKIEKKGVPCKNWFTIIESKVKDMLNSVQLPKFKELVPQDLGNKIPNSLSTSSLPDGVLLYNNINNNNINNNISSEEVNKVTSSSAKKNKSFSRSDYIQCVSLFNENKKLLKSKGLSVDETNFTFAYYQKVLKKWFSEYGPEKVKEGIRKSINIKGLVNKGYKATALFSDAWFPQCFSNQKDIDNGLYKPKQTKQSAVDKENVKMDADYYKNNSW